MASPPRAISQRAPPKNESGKHRYFMLSFLQLWLLIEGADHFDPESYNPLFRSELEALMPRVNDFQRRQSLLKMRDFNWAGYILAALRNAGFTNKTEREERAHEIITNLLVTGKLFRAYDPDKSGPIEQRFKVAVMYEIRSAKKQRAKQSRRSANSVAIGQPGEPGRIGSDEIPDTRTVPEFEDDNLIDGFRQFLKDKAGDDVLKIFEKKLEGISARKLTDMPEFKHLGKFRIERAMKTIQSLAHQYATLRQNDQLLNFIARVMQERERRAHRPVDFDPLTHNVERVLRLVQKAGPTGITRVRLHKNSHLPVRDLESSLAALNQDGRVQIDQAGIIYAVEPVGTLRDECFSQGRFGPYVRFSLTRSI